MEKFQNSKIFIRNFFGVVAFLGLFLVGCRRVEEPLPNASAQNATIEKIKAWYNPKVERLKGLKSTNTEIWYPQWDAGLIHSLPNGERIAVFPVMREKRVLYFNTGFVRKFVVRLTPQDSIQGVKIVEVIGKKDYLRDHAEEVVRRHQARTAQGMPVLVIEREVLFYANKNTISPSNGIMFIYEVYGGGGGFGIMFGGNLTLYELSPSNPTWGSIDAPPSGGTASGYGSFMGNYGYDYPPDSGGSGETTPTPTPDNSIYVDWGALANIGNIDWSAGWGNFTMPPFDFGINFDSPILNIPGDISSELLSIVDVVNSNMTNEEWKELDKAFTQARTSSCLFDAMYKIMKAKNWKFKWKSFTPVVQANGSAYEGYYDDGNKEIGLSKKSFLAPFEDEPVPLGNVIAEELFHAYQDVYSTYTNSGYDDVLRDGANALKGLVNLELEAKFFVDMTFQMTMMNTTPAYGKSTHTFDGLGGEKYAQDFEQWLLSITNNYTQMPQNYQALQGQYFQWVEKFKEAYKNTTYDTPIDYSKSPDALLNLIQVSGCNN